MGLAPCFQTGLFAFMHRGRGIKTPDAADPRQAGSEGQQGGKTRHQQDTKESSARLRKVPTRRSREEGTAAALWTGISGKRMQDVTA